MSYWGDYKDDATTVVMTFTTRAFATGVPATLAGTPVISVYKGTNTTPRTSAEADITLTVDFDGITGSNQIAINLATDAFFVAGSDYSCVITTGTVGGTSVVGETATTFSIENRFDEVSAIGTGGITAASFAADAIAAAGIATGAFTADAFAADALVAATFATGAFTADAFAADALVAATFATGAFTADAFAADALVAATFATGAFTADVFAADAIVAATLATDAISDDAVAADVYAQINAEVVDTLNVDTYAEPGQGAPAASASLVAKIGLLAKLARNKKTASATEGNLYNDAKDTVDQKWTISDAAGVTTSDELESGP